MKKCFKILGISLILLTLTLCLFNIYKIKNIENSQYSYEKYELVRNNIKLHLNRVKKIGKESNKNILLVHGVTYSSHEFDINYKDYSLVRTLAQKGYSVWCLDIAGYGQSEALKDGFMSNSEYASEDINAAVQKIIKLTGQEKIDLLGWSWGSVTTSKFVSNYPDKINKLILFAPILGGIGECDTSNPFHHNTWEHAVDDFQRDENGNIDFSITDPRLVESWASSCWHYDKDYSPNGGRCDICIDKTKEIINLSLIKTPTLLIYGDKDPYMNYVLLDTAQTLLPKGSSVEVIKGGSHVVFVEKPYYKIFQKSIIKFLNNNADTNN